MSNSTNPEIPSSRLWIIALLWLLIDLIIIALPLAAYLSDDNLLRMLLAAATSVIIYLGILFSERLLYDQSNLS